MVRRMGEMVIAHTENSSGHFNGRGNLVRQNYSACFAVISSADVLGTRVY
jgi:hypothetical protein